MGSHSPIEWTEATWNPVTGCTRVSEGCRHCYAERLAKRLKAMGNPRYQSGFDVTLHWDQIDLPLRWTKRKLIFVNSMSDLFHPKVPLEFVQRVFDTMARSPQHTFQVLTKRPSRAVELAPLLSWQPNIWMGTSIESADVLDRVASLQKLPATVRFLSIEPLLGQIEDLPLEGISWVIVGGESGPEARPMNVEWVREIRDQCVRQGISFFFKQWGGRNKKAAGRLLDGRTWDEFPLRSLEVAD